MPTEFDSVGRSLQRCQTVGTDAGGSHLEGEVVEIGVEIVVGVKGTYCHIGTVAGVVGQRHLENLPLADSAGMVHCVDGDKRAGIAVILHDAHFESMTTVRLGSIVDVEDQLRLVGCINVGVELRQDNVRNIGACAAIHVDGAASRTRVVVGSGNVSVGAIRAGAEPTVGQTASAGTPVVEVFGEGQRGDRSTLGSGADRGGQRLVATRHNHEFIVGAAVQASELVRGSGDTHGCGGVVAFVQRTVVEVP